MWSARPAHLGRHGPRHRRVSQRHLDAAAAGRRLRRDLRLVAREKNEQASFGPHVFDGNIATIIDYERSSWGNHGKLVTAAQVTAERGRSK